MSKHCEMPTKFLHSTKKKFVSLSYNEHGYGEFFFILLWFI